MKRQIFWLLILFCIFCMLISSEAPLAAPYYEGKVVKIIVGTGAGGGYDHMARLLAKHLPKYIPGKPVFIVENMPGAGHIIAANYIYNSAKADGLTIGTVNRGLPIAQLTKIEGVKFDIRKFSWIGSAAVEAIVLALRTDLPYKTLDDIRKAKEPIPLALMGPGSSDSHFTLLLRDFLKFNFKLVNYPSSNAGMLAVEQKEVDGRAGTYSSLKPYIERGLVRPYIRGRVSEPGIENLPVDEDLTTDPVGKTIMALRSAPDQMGRPYVAPPGTPPELMKILKDAFVKVEKDPELKKDANKYMTDVEYVSADECMKIINYILNQPEGIVKEFSKYIKF